LQLYSALAIELKIVDLGDVDDPATNVSEAVVELQIVRLFGWMHGSPSGLLGLSEFESGEASS
jgi:hypothetical protein